MEDSTDHCHTMIGRVGVAWAYSPLPYAHSEGTLPGLPRLQ